MCNVRTESQRMSGSIRATLVAVCLLLRAVHARADHCPEEATATVDPERSLAGIGFERGGFAAVRSRLGPPTSVEYFDADGPARGLGEARYVWQLKSVRLEVVAAAYEEAGKRIETAGSVLIEGTKGNNRLRTGRGLGLGDTLMRAEELYGSTFIEGSVSGPEFSRDTVTFCFSNQTELSVGLSAEQVVTAIWLAPSAE